jgi:hypothetical protein
LRLFADPRLLTLEVTARGARKAQRCELPSDMRAGADLGRVLILPPKRAYSATFEPRLYCFSRKSLDALSPGAVVVGELGFKGRSKMGPYEISPIDGVVPEVAPRKVLRSLPIALPDDPTPAIAGAASAPVSDQDPPRLKLSAAQTVDALDPDQAEVALTLRNEGSQAVIVRFRPETVAFDLLGSGGAERCSWPVMPAAPMRELFATLPPHGATHLTVLLSSYCQGPSLDHGGLFAIRPWMDTTAASGQTIGLPSFDGRLVSESLSFLRLHRGRQAEPLQVPQLDPAE